MDDILALRPGQPSAATQGKPANRNATIYFVRQELMTILNVYGRMVSAGQWRDYAIDHGKGKATFSIFRRASEMPMFSIVKEPALANQQGMWRILGMDGRILKRGKDLDVLLRYFDRHLVRAVD